MAKIKYKNGSDVKTLLDTSAMFQIKQISAAPIAVELGSDYTFGADIPSLPGYAPVGVVGVSSDHPASLFTLACDVSSNKAWLQANCKYTQSSITVRWNILYIAST